MNTYLIASLATVGLVSGPYAEGCTSCELSPQQDHRREYLKKEQVEALTLQANRLQTQARKFIAEDRLDEAETCLRTALQMILSSDLLIQREPYFKSLPFRELLARIAIKRNLWHEAVAHLTDATEYHPKDLHKSLLGWVKLRAGDVEGSRAMWEPFTGAGRYFDAMPHKSDTLAGLEAMWLTKIGTLANMNEELHWFTLAHEKEPTNPYVNDKLGSLLHTAALQLRGQPGNLEERISLLKRAYDHHITAMRNAPDEELRLEFDRNATGPRIRMETLIKQRDGGYSSATDSTVGIGSLCASP